MKNLTVFLLFATLLVSCGYDDYGYFGYPDFHTPAFRKPRQTTDQNTTATPITIVKTSKEAFLSAFIGQEWSNVEMFEMDDKGTWKPFQWTGVGRGTMTVENDHELKNTFLDAGGVETRTVTLNYTYDEKTQSLVFNSSPSCFVALNDTMKVASANKEYIVLYEWDERHQEYIVFILESNGNAEHHPKSNTSASWPFKKAEITPEEIMQTYISLAWIPANCYGVYKDGTLGRWNEIDNTNRLFLANGDEELKEYFVWQGKNVQHTCPARFDPISSCLMLQKEDMPTSFAGFSDKLHVLSAFSNNLWTQGRLVLLQETNGQSKFKYILYSFWSTSLEDVEKWDSQYPEEYHPQE